MSDVNGGQRPEKDEPSPDPTPEPQALAPEPEPEPTVGSEPEPHPLAPEPEPTVGSEPEPAAPTAPASEPANPSEPDTPPPTTTAGEYQPPPPLPPPLPPQGAYPPPPGGNPPQPPSGGYPPPPPGGYPPPDRPRRVATRRRPRWLPAAAPRGYPPPPPAGGYPPPAGAYGSPGGPAGYGQRRTFSATDAFTYGWYGFKANIGPLVVIGLVVIAAEIVAGVLQQGFDSWVLSVALYLVGAFISLVISLGLIRAALAILDGRHPTVEEVISTRDIVPYIIASLLVTACVLVGLLLCIIPGLIAGFLLQFYGYAIADRKVDDLATVAQSDPVGSMRASFQVTSKNVGDLILLALLAFVANLVGALLCGIGLLVSLPVTAIAVAYAWRYFSGGVIAAQPQ